jgi:hypothetical protein
LRPFGVSAVRAVGVPVSSPPGTPACWRRPWPVTAPLARQVPGEGHRAPGPVVESWASHARRPDSVTERTDHGRTVTTSCGRSRCHPTP